MDFKFEPGNYYLAGREQLDGTQVLRIEYYPTHMFDDDDHDRDDRKSEKRARRRRATRAAGGGQDIERKMNKTAMVTLWIDPAEHQIVKYTFDNVWMDFLPGALAGARRRHPRLDDHGPAVPRHLAAARA